jgi:hypothetical protein
MFYEDNIVITQIIFRWSSIPSRIGIWKCWFLRREENRRTRRKTLEADNCFGFIDGTVRPICRPKQNQKTVYNGHKRVHALKFQSVALPCGMIANMYGPVGKRNDQCENNIIIYWRNLNIVNRLIKAVALFQQVVQNVSILTWNAVVLLSDNMLFVLSYEKKAYIMS